MWLYNQLKSENFTSDDSDDSEGEFYEGNFTP